MCQLHDEGRDHIWSYYVRNQVRPVWMARPGNEVDVLIGNPPWLSYSHMTLRMKRDFQTACKDRGLWPSGRAAATQDLSAYFVARSVELYLREGGVFSFVMPAAVLTRQQYEGFRHADFTGPSDVLVNFGAPKDLTGIKPPPFPVPSAVITGRRTRDGRRAMPADVERLSGRIAVAAHRWADVSGALASSNASSIVASTGARSPYANRFSAGANIRPRSLVCVQDAPSSPLGVGRGRRAVVSPSSVKRRSPGSRCHPVQELLSPNLFDRSTSA